MSVNKSRKSQPFSPVITRLRPYLYSLLLVMVSAGMLRLCDQFLVRYALPWALVGLLVVAAVVVLWGVRPALIVLTMAALFGDVLAPDLHISYFTGEQAPWDVHVIRMMLFTVCGGTIIWLAHQARTMREKTERKRAVLHAMQALAAPTHLAKVDGWDVAALYLPAHVEEEVGGDFYDFFAIDTGEKKCMGVLVGDVMGKGKEAAIHTAMLRYTVRTFANLGFCPCDVLRRVNELIYADPQAPTASLFFGCIDAETGAMEYASAGHEPPLMFSTSGSIEKLMPTGPVVGVDCEAAYEMRQTQIDFGAQVLFFTDGVTEARSAFGQFLDIDGAIVLFQQSACGEPHRTVHRFAERVTEYAGGNNRDDIAVMVLERHKSRSADVPPVDEQRERREPHYAAKRNLL
jgi:hypothetical protein